MSAFDQGRYQVRLDWGVEGALRLAPADVYVVVDAIGVSSEVAAAVAAGERPALDRATAAGAVASAVAAHLPGALVLVGAPRNAAAVARAIKAEQERRAARTSIALIPVGAPADTGLRFAVEDLLGAGAVADALVPLGIDHSAPEAVAAAEAFRALRRAVKHLFTASGSGLELEAQGRIAEARVAATVDDLEVVPVLDGERFRPF